ncbi:MAG: gamma carbonic anhydrase family protein [candidate division WOR-3 bacterium]
MPLILPFEGKSPRIRDAIFIAETAVITGDVELGPGTSVWYGAILRGDTNSIRIGENTNIQDLCVLHGDADWPVKVGKRVTIGHGAIVHGCEIGDDCLIGMASVIMNGCVVGPESIIAGGTVLTPGSQIPPRSLVAGVPGKVKRELSQEEIDGLIRHSWEVYVELAHRNRKGSI